MLKCKSLLDYLNLFSPKECQKNDKTILKYFQKFFINILFMNRSFKKAKMNISIELTAISIENLNIL